MDTIINQKIKKIKQKVKRTLSKIFYFLVSDVGLYIILLIFIAFSSFLLGRFSIYEKDYLNQGSLKNKIIYKNNQEEQKEVKIVVSKNGSVYHLPWCSGAIKMKEENKIFFKSKSEAEKAGYAPAKNCEGL